VKPSLKGIQVAPHAPNRGAVRALLSGSESEAMEAVRHHKDNAEWLKMADDVEFKKLRPRTAVLSLIREILNNA